MNILAIGAHLDDAEIGCGGMLASAAEQGHHVRVLALSDSGYANYDGRILRTAEEACSEGHAAVKELGVSELEVLAFPTKDIPYHSTVVEAIETRLRDFEPDIILTHWPFDTHQAHHHTALSTIAAARYHTSILMYEPMMPAGRSYMGFRPQVYVDVTASLPRKLAALRAHTSQYQKYGSAWIDAVESRCRLRGFEMGVTYAEAFEAVRFQWKP